MRVAIIVATDLDGVIGRENRLPWHLPADLRHFKRLTMGKPMVMGRRTFESIGRALPGRASIVLTRNRDFVAPGCETTHTAAEALARAERAAARLAGAAADAEPSDPPIEVMVIGGAEIFREFLPLAHRIYWTEVQAHIGGDTTFPTIDPGEWREIEREDLPAGPGSPYALCFRTLERHSDRPGDERGGPARGRLDRPPGSP